MEAPTSLKEVQKLSRRLATLGIFISISWEKCFPFFKALKQVKDFIWNDESQKTFEELKKYMAKPPLLAKPIADEVLYLYLAVSDKAISAILVKYKETVQKSIYYVSKTLHSTELNYSAIEKFALAMITTLRKLRPYF